MDPVLDSCFLISVRAIITLSLAKRAKVVHPCRERIKEKVSCFDFGHCSDKEFDMVISERLGSSNTKEQYAYIYR